MGAHIHIVHEGDCLDLMRKFDDESVDLILTDAPYGIAYQSSHRFDKMKRIEGDRSCNAFTAALPDMVRVLRPDRHAYFFCSWHKVDVFKLAIERHLTIKNIIVWVKNNHGAGDLAGSYAPKHELIIFAQKGRRPLRGKRTPDVITCAKVPGCLMVHPTEKPIELLRQFVEASTDPGEIVFDPFAGSFTTAIAAERCKRDWIGIERDPDYCQTARERLARERSRAG